MFKDTRGLEMTASSQEAVDAFDATVAEFLAAGRDAAVLLKHVNETDPDMIMGQCVRLLHAATATGASHPRQRRCVCQSGHAPRRRQSAREDACLRAGSVVQGGHSPNERHLGTDPGRVPA